MTKAQQSQLMNAPAMQGPPPQMQHLYDQSLQNQQVPQGYKTGYNAPGGNDPRQQRPQQPQLSRLTMVWQKTSDYVKARDYESAYRLMLKEGDDMYLLRLIVQTGPVTKELDKSVSRQVMARLNKIVRGGIFETLEVEWIDDSKRSGLFQTLSMNEQNEYLDTLYQLSRNTHHSEQLSVRAGEVYQAVRAHTARQLSKFGGGLP